MRTGLLIAVLVVSAVAQNYCTAPFLYTSSNGQYKYDLSPLVLTNGRTYTTTATGKTDNKLYTYTINICGTVPCGNGPIAAQAASCQSFGDPGSLTYKVTGTIAEVEVEDGLAGVNNGFMISYYNGSTCSSGQQRASLIQVVCHPEVTEPILSFVGEDLRCEYQFTLTTKYGCPLGGGEDKTLTPAKNAMSTIGIIFIVLFVAFFLYCCIGVLYNRHKGAKEGEQIPNYRFWSYLLQCKCLPSRGSGHSQMGASSFTDEI